MAVKTRKGKKGGKGRKAASANGSVETSSPVAAKARRTAADVDALVPEFRSHLQDGGTMKALKAEHGFSSDVPIREALARAGYDSKGNKLDVEPFGVTGAKLAKALVAARSEGQPWYILALRADLTESEVKTIVEEAGGPASGRVYREKAVKPKAAKKAAAKKGGKKGRKSTTDPSA